LVPPSIADGVLGEGRPESIPDPWPNPGGEDRWVGIVNAPSANTGPIRLLLVDSLRAVRRGLKMRLALEDDLEVVGETGDATEAIPLARALSPDAIVMDLEIPGVSGIETTQRLRAAAPRSVVVIFTLRDDAATREQARAAGATAFVAKHQTEETLLAAIRRVTVTHGKQSLPAPASSEEDHRDDPH
jgi:DNA-binding NarL/FixJ family response regulator